MVEAARLISPIAAPSPVARPRSQVRVEIQALRALAVGLVVLHHLWPSIVRGGYVGVDVFFTISGYLITLHLVSGAAAEPPKRLGDFYARRIRRLLPASVTVLLLTAAATVLFVPNFLWEEVGRQLGASALYVQNWALALNAVDYSAPTTDVSPVQHFWSLSVEEQFYLGWPLLLMLGFWLSRRRSLRRAGGPEGSTATTTVAALLGTVALASLAYSVHLTARDSSLAYFATPARAWEFALGGLLALAPLPLERGAAWLRALLSWAGFLLIGVSALAYTTSTPFPGYAALVPCLGAAAVIAAGSPGSPMSTAPWLRLRLVQLTGDLSYSLYLVHWPLVVILPFALGRSLDTWTKLAILPVSFGLALLSKILVEDRWRRPSPGEKGGRVFVAALLAMVLVATAGGAIFAAAQVSARHARSQLQRSSSTAGACFGAGSLADPTGCAPQTDVRAATVVPAPVIAEDDMPPRSCQSDTAVVEVCVFGGSGAGSLDVALVGDSHATQWLPALQVLAEQHDWKITTYLKSGCAFSAATKIGVPDSTESCTAWNAKVLPMVVQGAYSLVFTSGVTGNRYHTTAGETSQQAAVAGLQQTWSAVEASGAQLVSLRDTPRPDRAGSRNLVECVARRATTGPCRVSQVRAELADYQEQAVAGVAGARLVDLTDSFCTSGWCPAVVGGVLVYRDRNHVTETYMRTLAPQLEHRLQTLMPGAF